MRVNQAKFRGIVRILIVILVLDSAISLYSLADQTAPGPISLDRLCTALNLKIDRTLKTAVLAHLYRYQNEGLGQAYRQIYTDFSSASQLKINAACLAGLLISQNLVERIDQQRIGKRLFIDYLNRFHREIAAIAGLSQLDNELKIFSSDPEILNLYRSLIRNIWYENEKTADETLKNGFLSNLPWFAAEINAKQKESSETEEKWEFILKPGKTGENEEDFELKKKQ
ncbi:MAG: hypothetical protein ACOYXC_20980 [Candidatus Rifleibacteriota bacterium]